MAKQVVQGATLNCAMGTSPSNLMMMPFPEKAGGQVAANIVDNKPLVNIMPFGMCRSLANPTVASATAAAQGVLTPMPCVPNTPAPWTPGAPTVLLRQMPTLNNSSKLMCVWGGCISVNNPGQMTVDVP
jgi:hypothetical protein